MKNHLLIAKSHASNFYAYNGIVKAVLFLKMEKLFHSRE